MRTSQIALLLGVTLVALMGHVLASKNITCITCSSVAPLEKWCQDPFQRNLTTVRTGWCHGHCTKLHLKESGATIRTCKGSEDKADVGCKEVESKDTNSLGRGLLCVCDHDFCNTASLHSPSPLFFFFFFLFFFVVTTGCRAVST